MYTQKADEIQEDGRSSYNEILRLSSLKSGFWEQRCGFELNHRETGSSLNRF
ncbi:hypothetical protein GJ744_008074 [Endocarpon pusillum]|uniref:Uncharacterized protein n=1 Tax=Endocarpon pusillum TaxID=364733 RepID=A0A8H7E751_9EURO|nr:hypothetical protein GJ744_008074 [Endocarpon pusillum]